MFNTLYLTDGGVSTQPHEPRVHKGALNSFID